MSDKAVLNHDPLGAAYLQQLQALAAEICVAMDAIAANALTSFQESVAKQEMLCASLSTMAGVLGDNSGPGDQPPASDTDGGIELKIRIARQAIRELNLQYAALLKHSGKSIALLLSLCRSHTGRFQEARGPRLKQQTWSCEM